MSNFYETLGVSRTATPEEIKRAYRKLARETHPDVAGEASAERFKEVSRAYEVLSDPEKRQLYDMGGEQALNGGRSGGAGANFGFSDIFETFFGGTTRSSGPVPRGRRGQDAIVTIDITLEEAVFGAKRDITVNTAVTCPACQGSCCRPGTSPETCSACQGRGSVQRVANSFLGQIMTTSPCGVCRGHGTIIQDPCPECSGDGRVRSRRTINIDIPAGVESGNRMRMPGYGEVGPGNGPAGDLHVEFKVADHPIFSRQGDDLVCSVSVPATAAALGTTITLETLDGPREITLKAGTQPGDVHSIRGLGATRIHRGTRGDVKVFVDVTVPKKLSDREKELMRELAELRGEEHPEIKPGTGIFSRLKEKMGL
ncbi:molecular chaperone DnaJ [Ruaniaceae bacterium KH17]|nr:molecular chaperone DnaJ [Ruaniaceae bacterium KH17]